VSFLPNRRPLPSLAAAFLLCLLATAVWPVEQLELSLGALRGEAWQLEGADLTIDWSADANQVFGLDIQRFSHRLLPYPVDALHVACKAGVIADREIRCEQGQLTLETPLLSARAAALQFNWQPVTAAFGLRVQGLIVAGGYLALTLAEEQGRWQLQMEAAKLSIDELLKAGSRFGVADQAITASGDLSSSLTVSGNDQALDSGNWHLDLGKLAFSDDAGRFLSEGLQLNLQGSLMRQGKAYAGDQRVDILEGAILTPFAYLSPQRGAIQVQSKFELSGDGQRLSLRDLTYRDPGLLEFSGNLQLLLGDTLAVTKGELTSQWIDAGPLFERYLQPVLGDPLFDAFQLAGRIRLSWIRAANSVVTLSLSNLSLEQDTQLLLTGVDGELTWRSKGSSAANAISWKGGRLLSVPFGRTRFSLRIDPDAITLESSMRLPLWDGELHVDQLSLSRPGPELKGRFQGYLTPISMTLVSEAFGWPTLAGQLSGMIPLIQYEDGTLSIEGTLLIRIFGGRILIRHLQLEDLFGPLPVLTADIQVHDLDLETLTRTFSFGKITGRLEGRIDGLRLEDWTPVSFDARFRTPEDDDSRHRISQKAVDNISNLGGAGISGALSRSFLRFFEEFGYDRLGISCRLQDGICDMGGVEPAKAGYYLVKGGGIPRIDIMGFNRRTDWNILVDKLREISESDEAPMIE